MTPPTVAPGSALVMRRQGTSHDAGHSSFYVQQQPNTMGSQQDNSAGNNKPKKSWGERLKLGKGDKNREERPQISSGVSTSPDNSYLLQEYRNKYGTLSSGSALSKSMKYAETWLYGSVAVRSPTNGSNPRPSLFLYHHHPPPPVAVIPASQAVVIPPGTNYAVVMCSCPEFLTGTARSKKSSSAVCKKCGGSRVLWNMNKSGGTLRASGTVRGMNSGGTVRGMGGTLRLGGGSSGQNRVRPSLLNLGPNPQPTQNSKSSPQQPLKSTTPDPYDLMRRNRLGGVNNNEFPMQYEVLETCGLDSVRVRAKSTSPCRRRSPSPSVVRAGRRVSRRDLAWEREYPTWNSNVDPADNSKRKSILECDVNAYELIAKYLKNGNRPPAENGEVRSMNEYGRANVVSDEDVLDDELSDDLSDNALENTLPNKSNIPTLSKKRANNTVSLQPKTDTNITALQHNSSGKPSTNELEKSLPTGTRAAGVTLGGQRIRLFHESTPINGENTVPNTEINQVKHDYSNANGKPENEIEAGTLREQSGLRNTPGPSSLIPRLASPRRPPRKLKANNNNNEGVIQRAEEDENESGGHHNINHHHHYTDAAESSPSGLSQAKDGRSPSTTEGVCIIKSILKKPSTLSPGDTATSLKTFGDTISKPDSVSAVSSEHSPSPEVAAGSGSTDFYLPTFQEFKQQIRKKKQVQFKVANDVAVLQPVEEEDHVVTPSSTPVTDSSPVDNLKIEATKSNLQAHIDKWSENRDRKNKENKQSSAKNDKHSGSDLKADETFENCDKDKRKYLTNDVKVGDDDNKGCEVKLQYFGEVDVTVVNNGSNGSGEKSAGDVPTTSPAGFDAPAVVGGIIDNTTPSATATAEDLVKGKRTVVSLRRSLSERLLPTTSGSLRGCDSKLQQGVDFNDTMRLRLRPGRPDIRQVFSDPGAPGTYTTSDTPKRPQRMLSPGRPRPKEPPPPPPPPSFGYESAQQPLPELPPRQIFPFTKKQIEQMNNQARQFSIKSQNKQKKITSISKGIKAYESEQSVPSNIRPVSWSPLMESTLHDTFEVGNINPIVKKKEHRHSDPGPIAPKIIVHIENSSETHLKDSAMQTETDMDSNLSYRRIENQDDRNSLPKMAKREYDRSDGKVGTIVTVSSSAPGSPLADIHRLQIKSEDPKLDVSPAPQRRTSILITNDESPFSANPSTTSLVVQGDASPVKKDSSNKVTICVGGDPVSTPFQFKSQNNTNFSSSCTIIDTTPPSTLNLGKSYNKQNCSSLTVLSSSSSEVNVIPVSQEPVQRTLLVVDHRDSENKVLQCWGDQQSYVNNNDIRVLNNTITIVDNKEDIVREPVSNIVLTYKSRGVDSISEANSKDDILLNPVEAVKRNLIPHVCGKKNEMGDEENHDAEPSPAERLNRLIEMADELGDHDTETMKEGDYCIAAAVSKLLETTSEDSGPIYSNISSTTTTASKSSEDTLPTVLEQEEGDDDVFRTESVSLAEADEPTSGSSYDEECRAEDKTLSFPGDSSGCDTAPSSIEPENEGTDDNETDSTSTSHLLLSLSLQDSTALKLEKDDQEEVEIQEDKNESSIETHAEGSDENHYESIKDPIYEEIPDTPPPLPLSPPPSLDDLEDSKRTSRSIFEGASKYDILSYLVGAKERGIVPEETYYGGSNNGDEIIEIIDGKPMNGEEENNQNHQRMTSLDLGDLSSRVSHLSNASDSSEDSCHLIISNIGDTPSSPNKIRKSSAEIERNDSGVGSETSKSSRSRWQHCGHASSIREDQQHLCEDCDQPVETQVTDSGVMFAPLVCRKCGKKRAERKEIIAEIVETEEKYGRDLQIIMDEFYSPMLVAGLLTPEQLSAIFLNVEELLEHNAALAEKLRDNLEIAVEQGDEDLLTVNIGKLFLEAAPMLHAFESYCIRQGAASLLLANLEKEKELLRIFLRVSQMENAVLRRMNLNSFLMVPVQRVTKYPLLLARLHKVTPTHHEGRDLLKQSQHKIELHLEHMNSEAKDISTTKLWRRISIMNGRRSSSETDMLSIKLRKMALDILEWNHDEVRFAMEGKLLYTNPADNNWRKSRTIKLNPINALLVTNGKPTEDYRPDPTEDSLMFPRKTGVREATLLLLKEKCGRYTQLRDPLYLDRCIVCSETDSEEYFEVQELASKDTFIFKAEDGERTRLWYRQLQYHAQGMGAWRRRRNALANIMINGMQTRN